MVNDNWVMDILECMEGTYIKVRCAKCETEIQLCYSDWENPTKPYKKKRTCDCGHEWGIKIAAEIKR